MLQGAAHRPGRPQQVGHEQHGEKERAQVVGAQVRLEPILRHHPAGCMRSPGMQPSACCPVHAMSAHTQGLAPAC